MSSSVDYHEIVGWTPEGMPVRYEDVLAAACEIRDLLVLKVISGRFSNRLAAQLAGHWCRLPEPFDGAPLLVDVHEVVNQIGMMEGAQHSRAVPTKPATQFTSGPLCGLWHKHWFQASFMIDNLALENERSGLKLIHKSLRERLGSDYLDGRSIGKREIKAIAHAVVIDAIEHRAGSQRPGTASRLTGEWIVFARSGSRNYYLTLARHRETNEAILGRCQSCLSEFPELGAQEPFVQF